MYYQMNGNATVDEKPICVILEEARSHTHAPSANVPQNPLPSMLSPPTPYGCPAAPPPPPVIVLPPWGMPSVPQNYGMGGGGPYSNQLPDIQLRAPSPNPSLLNSQGSSTTTQSNSPLPLPANIPDIITWFEYDHRHESLKKNQPNFKDFGPIMESKGFYDISQLSNNDFFNW